MEWMEFRSKDPNRLHKDIFSCDYLFYRIILALTVFILGRIDGMDGISVQGPKPSAQRHLAEHA